MVGSAVRAGAEPGFGADWDLGQACGLLRLARVPAEWRSGDQADRVAACCVKAGLSFFR